MKTIILLVTTSASCLVINHSNLLNITFTPENIETKFLVASKTAKAVTPPVDRNRRNGHNSSEET
ncbi:MAG: hypothetical protein AAGA80_04695 [Cyanobacteria bacterium P01_F01_bin.143]